jgi:hypothetical protein
MESVFHLFYLFNIPAEAVKEAFPKRGGYSGAAWLALVKKYAAEDRGSVIKR